MKENDLFGNPVSRPVFGDIVRGAKKKRKDPTPAGYAARPGTGPPGEKCKTCGNLYENRMSKSYWKCIIMRHCWTGGRKTDVLVNSPACSRWEVK